MLNRIIKIAIAAALLGLSVWQFIEGEIGNGIFLFLLIAIPIFLIFRNENILIAFWYIRKQNFQKADSFLNRIKKPDELIKRQRAYYYYLKGLMDSQVNKSMGKAESNFKKAINIGLGMKHDEAMAKINLAGIAVSKRRKREAMNYIREVKKMKEASMFKEQIKQVETFMKKI